MGKTPSSHIIHSLGGEYCVIVRDSEPIRLLKSPRSLSDQRMLSPRSSASANNTLLDLHNSSYPTQPHSLIANLLFTGITCKYNNKLYSTVSYLKGHSQL